MRLDMATEDHVCCVGAGCGGRGRGWLFLWARWVQAETALLLKSLSRGWAEAAPNDFDARQFAGGRRNLPGMVMRFFPCAGFVFIAVLLGSLSGCREPSPALRAVRIMAVGDSITAGADFFSSYRPLLMRKLVAAGETVEFVGTQHSDSEFGPLAHEGYGGKNAEYLAKTVPEHFRLHPADIVLLHAGHNHEASEQPVAGIVAAHAQLIAAFRAINPRVTVLLAQVIPAGKLPKYSYLPALNTELAALAARLDTPAQRVILVDQAAGFDWRTDTVADLVHPNAQGAEKIAQVWFDALQPRLAPVH